MATIQTKGLTYRYGIGTPFEKTAVDHVDLEIESGSFVGIIGHTGSGKSTLIQHLNGLLKPTEGSILLDGKDIWAEKAQMRRYCRKLKSCQRAAEEKNDRHST